MPLRGSSLWWVLVCLCALTSELRAQSDLLSDAQRTAAPAAEAFVAEPGPEAPPGQPLAPIFLEEKGPPAGFENLSRPERTLVDVYYGGVALQPALAEFTDDSIQFDNPRAIVMAIPALMHPDIVLAVLNEPLDSHSELVCKAVGIPVDCGSLRPDVAGVIFDAPHFEVEIFVDPGLLALAPVNEEQRLPPRLNEWTGLATLGGSFSGTSNSKTFSDLRADALVGYGPGYFRFLGTLQDGTDFDIDRMFVSADWRDLELTAGIAYSRPLQVLGEKQFIGVRAATSLRTRTKVYLDRAYGSELPVFLHRRSQVQIFRDGRLLTSGIYDAGNVNLDTSELPEGAYQLELRIQDPIAGLREEERFFAKTMEYPPVGEPFYVGEIGALRDRGRPSSVVGAQSAGFMHLGAALRHKDNFGFSGDVTWVDKDVLFSPGLLWFMPHFSVLGAPIISHRGAGGLSLIASARYDKLFGNFNLRGFWGETGSRNVRTDYLDLTTTAGYYWRDIRFALRSDIRRRTGFDEIQYSITPSINYIFLSRGKLHGDVSIEYTASNRANLFIVRFNFWEWYKDLFLTQSAGGGYRDNNGDSGGYREIDLRAEWNSRHRWPVQVRNHLQLSDRNDRTAFGGTTHVDGSRGAASAYVEGVWPRDGPDHAAYGGLFSVGLTGDRHGVQVGGESAGTSAIVVDLSGEPKGGLFDVYANEIRVGTVRVGSAIVLPLASYETYAVRIVSKEDSFSTYDTGARRATLYPGSTVRMDWEIKRIYVLLTAVLQPDGTPLVDAFVRGAVGEAATDAAGFLQADVALGAELILTPSEGVPCTVRVPEESDDGEFVVPEQLVCHSTTQAYPRQPR